MALFWRIRLLMTASKGNIPCFEGGSRYYEGSIDESIGCIEYHLLPGCGIATFSIHHNIRESVAKVYYLESSQL